MTRTDLRKLFVAAFFLSSYGRVMAQAPIVNMEPEPGRAPGAGGSLLGPAPGAGGGSRGQEPPAAGGFLGGRPGVSTPRVPTSVSTPGARTGPLEEDRGIVLPTPLRTQPPPIYGTLEISTEGDDEGPLNGLTLDMAIEQLIRANLNLRAQFFEIPMAEADILTASLRANPIFYADSQLIPYGRYTKDRPGGQTQYDVNISYPFDLSHKRQARTVVATRARRVLEAQYQDAVRTTIDNLYTAFVDVLAIRQALRYSRASVKGLGEVLTATQQLYEKDLTTRADVNRIKIQLETARIGLVDAERLLVRSNQTLGGILNIPPAEAGSLQVRGTIRDTAPPPPPIEGLIQMALAGRPDLVSVRLGIRRAEADVRLALANRYSDVYMLYQPYTFQNNEPVGLKSATSWALGVTIPLPVYNRNQGGIQRAKLNVTQTQAQLAALERQVITEVQQAANEYLVSRQAVQRVRDELLTSARLVRDDTFQLYRGGEVNVVVYLNAQRDYNDAVRQYLDTVVRHRRSMLALNTAVGQRILP